MELQLIFTTFLSLQLWTITLLSIRSAGYQLNFLFKLCVSISLTNALMYTGLPDLVWYLWKQDTNCIITYLW